MEQYLAQLHTEFAAGRAAVAQQLHRLAQKGLVIAAPEVGDLLIGVIGGQTRDQVIAPPCDGDLLPGVIGGLVRPESGKNKKSKSAELRGVDSWESSGIGGVWKRCHRTPRRAMFTPHRVAGGPGHDTKLRKERTTRGTYLGTGKTFVIVDSYDDIASEHRLLSHGWIGTTEFREVDNETEDKIMVGDEKQKIVKSDEKEKIVGGDEQKKNKLAEARELRVLSSDSRDGLGKPVKRSTESASLCYLGRVSGRIMGASRHAACSTFKESACRALVQSVLAYCDSDAPSGACSAIAVGQELRGSVRQGACTQRRIRMYRLEELRARQTTLSFGSSCIRAAQKDRGR